MGGRSKRLPLVLGRYSDRALEGFELLQSCSRLPAMVDGSSSALSYLTGPVSICYSEVAGNTINEI